MKIKRLKNILKLIIHLSPVLLIFTFDTCEFKDHGMNPPIDTNGITFIAVADAETGKSRMLIKGTFPAPDPFSDVIYYSSSGLSAINIDGTDNRVILNSSYAVNSLEFTPDGKKILIHLYDNLTNYLYIINKDGSGLTKLLEMNPTPDTKVSVSSDMKKIVLLKGYDLTTIDLSGNNYKLLRSASDSTYFIHPRFLPDNDRIIYFEEYKWNQATPDRKGYIRVFTLSTNKDTVIERSDLQSEFEVSKDGKILFTDYDIQTGYKTMIMDSYNFKASLLAERFPWSSLSPDGKKVIYSSSSINIMDTDGSNRKTVIYASDTVRAYSRMAHDGKHIVHQASYERTFK